MPTDDPNYTYEVTTIVDARRKRDGQRFRNYGDGAGWQPLDDSTLQYSNQYNNNNYDGPPPLQW